MPHCKFCNKECKNNNSLRNHERLCKSNPNKQISNFEKLSPSERMMMRSNANITPSNQFMKAKSLGLPPPVVSKDTISKGIETKRKNGTLNYSEEQKKNHSSSMKRAVEEHPESYTSSNRGRTKQIEKYGLKFQGNWELLYYEWCIANSINVVRCSERFPYEWNGERSYNPDFYLPDSNTYIEVKGYETDRDRAKWKYFPHQLVIIRKKEIEEMKKFFKAVQDK